MGSLTLFLPIVITYSYYKLDIIEPFKTVLEFVVEPKAVKLDYFGEDLFK